MPALARNLSLVSVSDDTSEPAAAEEDSCTPVTRAVPPVGRVPPRRTQPARGKQTRANLADTESVSNFGSTGDDSDFSEAESMGTESVSNFGSTGDDSDFCEPESMCGDLDY